MNDKNYIYTFQWLTPLACPNVGRRKTNSNGKKLPVEVNTTTTNSVLINGLHYSVYVCTQNDNNCLGKIWYLLKVIEFSVPTTSLF